MMMMADHPGRRLLITQAHTRLMIMTRDKGSLHFNPQETESESKSQTEGRCWSLPHHSVLGIAGIMVLHRIGTNTSPNLDEPLFSPLGT